MGVKTYYDSLDDQIVGQAQFELNRTDYKVIKAMESYLVELNKLPVEFKEERDALRNRINEIRGEE
jgi:hypothetical protein